MTIKYLKHDDIDKTKWDQCIKKAINGIAYAYSWYLDITCNNWEALVEDDYISVFPLTANNKFTIPYLYQPFFIQHLGLFSSHTLNADKVNKFLRAIPLKFKYIEIKLSSYNQLTLPDYSTTINDNYELSMNSLYKSLYSTYSKNCKRNIKKAVKNNLRITNKLNPSEMIRLFRENKGKEYSNIKSKNYNDLLKIITACKNRNIGKIYGVYTPEEKLCAAAFFIITHNRSIFLFSGSNQEAKKLGAMPLLMDTFIKEHAEQNMILDFEGSNDKGVARFYKSFGSVKREYLGIKKNNLPIPIKWIKK